MSDLANILPEFAADRRRVELDLLERQADAFDKHVEEQTRRDLERIGKIIAESKDVSPIAAKPEAPPSSDLAEMQKQIERNGITGAVTPSIENRIKNAKEM